MYPIRTASQMTGIPSVTLRAWEARYGLIRPQRTAKGHRVYTREDIEKINDVLELLAQGIPISRVLQALEERNQAGFDHGETIWSEYEQKIIEAIGRFDEWALDAVYNTALSLYPVEWVTHQLLIPLLKKLGAQWESGQGNIGEEHFFSMYLRNKLGSQLHHSLQQQGVVVLGACFPGEHHVLGLLLFALAARARGYRVILLGENMPLEELPLVSVQAQAKAIVLSCSSAFPFQQHRLALAALVKELGLPVFVGGRGAVKNHHAIEKVNAISVGDDLRQGLNVIGKILPPSA